MNLAAKFWTNCSFFKLDLRVLLQIVEQQKNLLKIKALSSKRRVFLSSKCFILFIRVSLYRHEETVLDMCSLYDKVLSIKTPRSFATGTGEISFPRKVTGSGGNLRNSCGTPMKRSFVLTGLTNREFRQHHPAISTRSKFSSWMTLSISHGWKARKSLSSST